MNPTMNADEGLNKSLSGSDRYMRVISFQNLQPTLIAFVCQSVLARQWPPLIHVGTER